MHLTTYKRSIGTASYVAQCFNIFSVEITTSCRKCREVTKGSRVATYLIYDGRDLLYHKKKKHST